MPKNDLKIYDQLKSTWWSERNVFNQLIDFNPLRLSYYNQVPGGLRGKKILDAGCGGGLLTEVLTKSGAKTVGLDQSEGSVSEAKKHAQTSNLKISYIQGICEKLPFSDECFDIVIASQVLEHVQNRRQTLQEIARVLKSGGYFLFDLPNRTWFSRFALIFVGEYVTKMIPRGTHDGELFVRPQELKKEITEVAIDVKNIQGFLYLGRNLKGQHYFKFSNTKAFAYFGYGKKLINKKNI